MARRSGSTAPSACSRADDGARRNRGSVWATAMTSALLACAILLGLAGPVAAQEIRPTLDKIKEAGAIQLGYRETSRPFSFLGTDGNPAGYSVDLCLQVAVAIKQRLKLPDLKVSWVSVTPATRVARLAKGTIDLECGSTTITFSRMEQVAFSHMIMVDGGSLLATVTSGVGAVKDLSGKRVGVVANTTTEKALAAALAAASVKAQVIVIADHGEGVQGLEEGGSTPTPRTASSSQACSPPRRTPPSF